jgi:outer membrane lipoprotein-sorting protein
MRRILTTFGKRHIGVSAVAIFALTTQLGAQTLDAVYARLDKSSQQFKGVAADIRRDVYTAIVNDHTIESGTIKVKHEKGVTRMLIDFTGRDSKTVAFDGATVSIYYPKIKTVQIYDVGDKRSLIDQFLLLGFGSSSADLQAHYDVTWVGEETIDGKSTGHIQLIPKAKDVLMRLKKAELWIADNGMPLQQRFLTSTGGDSTLVTYSNSKLNPPLTDSSLKLKYPSGVQIQHPTL